MKAFVHVSIGGVSDAKFLPGIRIGGRKSAHIAD
jgi:hypothetical protein